ncbi:MAG: O-antigen ligase family protein [Anaerolineae bacterium]|nr:O-antigen ligase family protein [Anaerolineae bacterium]
MTAALARPPVSFRAALLWGGLAVLVGILVAWLPVIPLGGLLVLVGLGVAVLVEPAVGVMLMLAIAPLKTLIATEAPFTLPVDIGQIMLALVMFAWALWRVTGCRRHTSLPRTRLYGPLIGFIVAFMPSYFGAISAGAWLSEMVKWGEILLLVLIVLDLDHDPDCARRWPWIAFGLVLAGSLQALVGLWEFRGGSGAPHLWIAGFRFFRAFGTFGQPNPFSAFMGLILPLALGLAWGHAELAFRRWRERGAGWQQPGALAVLYGGFGVLLLGGLLASWGRGAWLGFGAAAVVMVCFAPRRRWQAVLLLVAGGILVAILWVMGFVPAGIQQRINNAVTEFTGFGDVRGVPVGDENFAIVERLAHWQAAYNMASDHPWLGVGLGNYEAVYAEYGVVSWPRPLGHAHNDYLNTLAETGMVGLSAYLIGWALIVIWTLRALRQPDPVMRGLVLGLLGTWTHLAVHSFVDKLYVNNLFLHIGVMLGLLAVAYRQHTEDL